MQQISETPLIKEKYGESSKRSSTSLESKSMLSLVKMFMKLKAEGFDIRPTRKDKVIENVKMDRQVSFRIMQYKKGYQLQMKKNIFHFIFSGPS